MKINKLLQSEVTIQRAKRWSNVAIFVNAAVFSVFAGAVVIYQVLPLWVIIPCAILSSISFSAYGTARHIQGLKGEDL